MFSMKRYLKKYTSLTKYIAFLRRQPEHVQHIYGVIFAGSITALIAFFILYVDYGFWHERYLQKDEVVIIEEGPPHGDSFNEKGKKPSDLFSDFFKEAETRFKSIDTSGKNFLNGKESYTSTDTQQ